MRTPVTRSCSNARSAGRSASPGPLPAARVFRAPLHSPSARRPSPCEAPARSLLLFGELLRTRPPCTKLPREGAAPTAMTSLVPDLLTCPSSAGGALRLRGELLTIKCFCLNVLSGVAAWSVGRVGSSSWRLSPPHHSHYADGHTEAQNCGWLRSLGLWGHRALPWGSLQPSA